MTNILTYGAAILYSAGFYHMTKGTSALVVEGNWGDIKGRLPTP